jgi:hypothetical protein
MLVTLNVLVVIFTVAAVVLQFFGNKEAGGSGCIPPLRSSRSSARSWRGRQSKASKQADVDAQRATLAKIEKNVEQLVAQGRLSREDAKRILVVMSESIGTSKFKEQLDIKVR